MIYNVIIIEENFTEQDGFEVESLIFNTKEKAINKYEELYKSYVNELVDDEDIKEEVIDLDGYYESNDEGDYYFAKDNSESVVMNSEQRITILLKEVKLQ